MNINKVIYRDKTLLDLTEDTISADKLMSGETAHDKTGEMITGSLIIQRYYVGTTEPDASFGNDGDIYLKVGE